MKHHIKLLLIGFILCSDLAFAAPVTLSEAKSKLKTLDDKISTLQNKLKKAKNKHDLLNKELAETDYKISDCVKALYAIEKDLQIKERTIHNLQGEIDHLSEQLSIQRRQLADQLRIRYQMDHHQPLKWLINQENTHDLNQLLTYYQYIIRSQQHHIVETKKTKQALDAKKEVFKTAVAQQQKLQNQLSTRQLMLAKEKRYQSRLIKNLHDEIDKKNTSLQDCEENKKNLHRLIQSLAQQNNANASTPFARLRSKLRHPVDVPRSEWKQINQGLMFFAHEGDLVQAVHPGKVVFSDWLKGYGLLLIIDHGRGFMTLYAHNQSLFKQLGDSVSQDEHIASIGHSGGIQQNGLYFEIRHRGKAISPLEWLS